MAKVKLPAKEKDIQKACLQWLQANGALAIRINSGAMSGDHKGKRWFMRFNSEPGCSDIIGLWPMMGAQSPYETTEPLGRFLAVEVKQPGKKPTALQESFLAEVKKRGGIALCVSSVDELREALRG